MHDKTGRIKIVYEGTGLCPQLGVAISGSFKGWLMVKHPDGQFVSLYDLAENFQDNKEDSQNVNQHTNCKMPDTCEL